MSSGEDIETISLGDEASPWVRETVTDLQCFILEAPMDPRQAVVSSRQLDLNTWMGALWVEEARTDNRGLEPSAGACRRLGQPGTWRPGLEAEKS